MASRGKGKQKPKAKQRLTLKGKQTLRPYLSEGLELPFTEFLVRYGDFGPEELVEENISSRQGETIDWDMVEAQVDMLFDDEELNIANELLGSLDHLGYLGIDLSGLAKQLKVNEEYVDQVRKKLMREVEPFGLGSVSQREFKQLLKELNLDSRDHPIDLPEERLRVTTPDFALELVDGKLEVNVSEKYEYLIQNTQGIPRMVAEYRKDLIMRLANFLVQHCGEKILEHKPCFVTLDHAAQELGVSKSTVSRLVRSKAFTFGGRVYPVEHFFGRSVKGVPQEELMLEIIDILKSMPTATDAQVSQLLRLRRGWKFSRRTVNKYRHMVAEYLQD